MTEQLREKIAHLRNKCNMSNCQYQAGTWKCDLCFADQIHTTYKKAGYVKLSPDQNFSKVIITLGSEQDYKRCRETNVKITVI